MKIPIFISILLPVVVYAYFNVDIDKESNSSYHIIIDNKEFYCTPKTPPLSHSWSYECQGTTNEGHIHTHKKNLRQ